MTLQHEQWNDMMAFGIPQSLNMDYSEMNTPTYMVEHPVKKKYVPFVCLSTSTHTAVFS